MDDRRHDRPGEQVPLAREAAVGMWRSRWYVVALTITLLVIFTVFMGKPLGQSIALSVTTIFLLLGFGLLLGRLLKRFKIFEKVFKITLISSVVLYLIFRIIKYLLT